MVEFGSMSVAVDGLHMNPSSLMAFRVAALLSGMLALEPFEYTLYKRRSPLKARASWPGSWASIEVWFSVTPLSVWPSWIAFGVVVLDVPVQAAARVCVAAPAVLGQSWSYRPCDSKNITSLI